MSKLGEERYGRMAHAADDEINHAMAEWQENGRHLKVGGSPEETAAVVPFIGRPAQSEEKGSAQTEMPDWARYGTGA